VKRLERYFNNSEIRKTPFSIISKNLKFEQDKVVQSPTSKYTDILTHEKRIMGKQVLFITDYSTHNLKNTPKSKSYTAAVTLPTGNPTPQNVLKLPFEHFISHKHVHKRLWEFWLEKGPQSLPSVEKLISMNLQWVNQLYPEEYKKYQDMKTSQHQSKKQKSQ